MTFRGWPSEALEFYEGLTADNSKTYWTAHLPFYEEQVRGPMQELRRHSTVTAHIARRLAERIGQPGDRIAEGLPHLGLG